MMTKYEEAIADFREVVEFFAIIIHLLLML